MSDFSRRLLEQEMMIRRARNELICFCLTIDEAYDASWHHVYLADVLERFYFGDIDRLMVWMPPQHGKTQLVNRFGIPWALGKNPDLKIAQASYGDDLATSINVDIQRIMESEVYHRIFPKTVIPHSFGYSKDNSKSELKRRTQKIFEIINARGGLRSTGVGGALTGQRADVLNIDDPHKDHKDALVATRRDDVEHWFNTTARTRTHKNSKISITQTRWHEDDLSGRLIEKQKALIKKGKKPKKPWYVVRFPAIKTADHKIPGDPREIGEALWPELHDIDSLESIMDDIPASWWSALYQQNPTEVEGAIIKRAWLKYYDELPKRMGIKVISCDLTFDDTDDSAFNVIACYAKEGPNVYLLDKIRIQADLIGQVDAILTMKERHPDALTTLIENKANGAGAMSLLKNKIGGIEPINPRESKEIRLSAVKSHYKNGNIYYPEGAEFNAGHTIDDHVTEIVSFPKYKYKDSVDAESQAIEYLAGNSFDRLAALAQM